MKVILSVIFFLFSLTVVLSQTSTTTNCPNEHALIERFNAAAIMWRVTGSCNTTSNSSFCHMEEDDDHDEHDDDHHDRKDTHQQEDDHHDDDEHNNSTACTNIYRMCRSIILGLNLTTEQCLEGHSHQHSTNNGTSTSKTSEAYGYGFLMIIFVSLCSLIGVLLVPLLNSESKVGRLTYEYVYAFMIAIGVSALISDAILHLIPHAFGLHAHAHGSESGDDGHGHSTTSGSTEEESQDFIWKGVLVLLGLYAFYLLEVALHGMGEWLQKKTGSSIAHHHHHHHREYSASTSKDHSTSKNHSTSEDHTDSQKIQLAEVGEKSESSHDSSTEDANDVGFKGKTVSFFTKIEPMAWLIIFGDAVHNFADGLALGAAIAQSLALGVSTMFAIIFHEIPHELGDYVILIKSGMHWITALIFNFISSLTAILGFFIGVAISTRIASANGWILAIAAGLFIYIAMTDLLPELIHGASYVKITSSGWQWWLRFLLINFGFLIAFAFLLVLAVYEEDLERLVE